MTRARPNQPAEPLAILQPWARHARCAGITNPEVFFPEPEESPEQALDLCAQCPARRPCLAFALEHHLSCGVWGGTTQDQRAALVHRTPAPERSAA